MITNDKTLTLRSNLLSSLGASESEIKELLAYNENFFKQPEYTDVFDVLMNDEPFIKSWQEYAREAENIGTYECLKSKLIQLRFPILSGISENASYQKAVKQGILDSACPEATGLVLKSPDQVQLKIFKSAAGRIPVIAAANREDFISILRSLVMRNEPVPVADSTGAYMVSGYNNWDRIATLRKQYQNEHPDDILGTGWSDEFKKIIPQKKLYQDRFILLSKGGYSAVAASDLDLDDAEWIKLSVTIRSAHEATHYLTRRICGSSKNRLIDEVIADFAGIIAAIDEYHASWFLRFIGLENYPVYREGGRMQNYKGDPPLSDGAFKILQSLVKIAAENIEKYYQSKTSRPSTQASTVASLLALTRFTLEELALTNAPDCLISVDSEIYDKINKRNEK